MKKLLTGICLLLSSTTFANNSDTVILLQGPNHSLTATCFARDELGKCTSLELDNHPDWNQNQTQCLEMDHTPQEISKHLADLEARHYEHPPAAVRPALNVANAVASNGSSEDLGPYFLAVLVIPADIALAPVELAAHGVSYILVGKKMNRVIINFKNFINGESNIKTTLTRKTGVFNSINDTLAYHTIVNSIEYSRPSCN